MAVVGHRDSFLNNIIPLCVFLLIILMMPASSSKVISNVFTTGQTLSRNSSRGPQLSYPNSNVSLVVTFYCDLVLHDYNDHVRYLYSNTGGDWRHRGCTLSFAENGRLVFTDKSGQQLWTSSNDKYRVGKYIAVLRPEAELVIYGPAIWVAGEPLVKENSISSSSDINSNEMVSSMTNLNNIPAIHNVLFSGQRLYNGDKISNNGYSLILDDCELILKDSRGKNSWQTWTHANGINCFVILENYGGLAILDEKKRVVWQSAVGLPLHFGEYALVIQSNGTTTIYGPNVWSSDVQTPRNDLIKMPIVEM